MRKSDKPQIESLFFQLHEIYESSNISRRELFTALRLETVMNSSVMENTMINPVMLRPALCGGGRVKEFSNPVYRKAFLEAKCHDKMLRYLEDRAAKRADLTVSLILSLHRMLFQESWPDIAGRFRDVDVRIRGVKHRPPHYSQIDELVYQHLSWIDGILRLLGPVNPNNFFEIFHVAADLHHRIVTTHPFHSGNWRIARALIDYILLFCGLTYCVIDHSAREEYLEAVNGSTLNDLSQFEDFLLGCYGDTLRRVANFISLAKRAAEMC